MHPTHCYHPAVHYSCVVYMSWNDIPVLACAFVRQTGRYCSPIRFPFANILSPPPPPPPPRRKLEQTNTQKGGGLPPAQSAWCLTLPELDEDWRPRVGTGMGWGRVMGWLARQNISKYTGAAHSLPHMLPQGRDSRLRTGSVRRRRISHSIVPPPSRALKRWAFRGQYIRR